MSNVDGYGAGGVMMYRAFEENGVGTFGKGNGIGDLEALLDAPPVQIGNRVWFDYDRDGVQDADELPIPGVTVTLSGCGVEPVTTTTGADGLYYFGELDGVAAGGACVITFDYSTADTSGLPGAPDPADLGFTTQAAGSDSELDSDVDPADGTLTVDVGTVVDHSLDAGVALMVELPPVGLDKKVDGADTIDGPLEVAAGETIAYTITVVNPSEEAVENLTVSDTLPAGTTYVSDDGAGLYDAATGVWTIGTLAADSSVTLSVTATVDDGVAIGDWITNTAQLAVDGMPVPDAPTPEQSDPTKNDEADDGLDNVDIVVPGECALGDFVWFDANENGVQDDGEDPIPDVTIRLYTEDGQLVGTTTSDEQGHYRFEGLECGRYRLEFDTPDGYEPTTQHAGDPGVDSNIDPAGSTGVFTLSPDLNPDLTWDAGYVTVDATVPPTTPSTTVPPPPNSPPDGGVPGPPDAGELPATGSDVGGILLVALRALVVGAGVWGVSRRRGAASPR